MAQEKPDHKAQSGPASQGYTGAPAWVKVAGVVVLVLVVLVVVLLLSGHGPVQHMGGAHAPGEVSAGPAAPAA